MSDREPETPLQSFFAASMMMLTILALYLLMPGVAL